MKFKKLTSVLLSAAIGLGSLSLAGAIQSQSEWAAANWSSIRASSGYLTMTPGADRTKINFSWQSSKKNKTGEIKISKNANMSSATSLSVSRSYNLLEGEYTYEATASGLTADTTYYYQYYADKVWSSVYSFTTGSTGETKVLFVTDPQLGRSGNSSNDSVLQQDTYGWTKTLDVATTTNTGIDFILCDGDQVEDAGSEDQYTLFESVPQLRNYPIATAIGNHDYYANNYSYHFNNPNDNTSVIFKNVAGNGYYFLYNDVLFIVLDSNNINPLAQEKILKAACKAYPDAKWRVVSMHHSPYDANSDKYTADVTSRTTCAKYFDDFNIDLCLCGHDHYYSRSKIVADNNLTGDVAVNNVYNSPKGTLYITGNSASGSNYYGVDQSAISKYSDFSFQSYVPCYSMLTVSGNTLNVTTYETGANGIVDTVSIVK